MADIFEVNIDLRDEGKTVLITPDKISVPQYSIIRWNVNYLKPYQWNFDAFSRGLIYTLYFRNDSPFFWKIQSLHFYGDPKEMQLDKEKLTIKLAEGEAEKNGDYKYGIGISEADTDKTLYDEDPYIFVF